MIFWISVLEASIRLSVPLLLLALGELVAERSGVINIGLEGMMSAGAFVGFLVMASSGDPHLACLAAIAAGMLVAAMMSGVSVWLGVNQILTGFAIFVMVPAITAFLHQQNLTSLIVTPALPLFSVEAFDYLPAIVRIFFSQNEFYYLTILLCFVVWILFSKTNFGLSLAACGQDPEVASSKGLSVKWLRTVATLICGAFAGLAGAALTVGALGQFNTGVTGGRGFIAIAAVILGRWRLGGVILAAAAIGFTDALRLRLSSQVHFPVDLLAMLPWIVVMLLLIAGSRVANVPRALGRNIGSTATN